MFYTNITICIGQFEEKKFCVDIKIIPLLTFQSS